MNGVIIGGLLDMGVDVSIVSPESWHPSWPLQYVNVQFWGIGYIAQVKQSAKWLECTGPEGQRGILKPYVVNIAINLWGQDLL